MESALRLGAEPALGAPKVRVEPGERAQSNQRPPAPKSPQKPSQSVGGGIFATFETLMMLAACAGVAAVLTATYEHSLGDGRVFPGVQLYGEAVGGLDRAGLGDAADVAAQRSLDRPLTLKAGEGEISTKARELGALPSPDAAIDSALAIGRSADLMTNLWERAQARQGKVDLAIGLRFDESRALDRLMELGPALDRPSLPTRMDLEARKILPAVRGTWLQPYDSLSNVAVGLAAGADTIELAIREKPPVEDPLGEIADQLDIGVLLGSFDTPYQTTEKAKDRTHNLKVGAAALDGYVLMPGETFSFNDVVGDRSAEAGYRYAPGISGGQIVDVLGGGICQVASTLYGAAFFAGLGVERQRPHSRPSSYVDMGLDATVVYPQIDLKLRNDFDFPIVIHMTVSQGEVHTEILGPRRPYQVAFEREINEFLPYRTVYRDDPRLKTGTTAIAQRGMRGFKVKRTRKLYQGGNVVQTDDWDLQYPPTTEIIRRGTSPEGEVPEPKTLPPLRDPAKHLRIVQ
jgi:vancomycin resistance protein YoaR